MEILISKEAKKELLKLSTSDLKELVAKIANYNYNCVITGQLDNGKTFVMNVMRYDDCADCGNEYDEVCFIETFIAYIPDSNINDYDRFLDLSNYVKGN